MHAFRRSSILLLLALAACGGDQSTQPGAQGGAPRAMQGGAVRQGAAPAFTTFSGNASQYTVTANANGFAVTDILTSQSTQVAAGARLRFADSAIALDLDGIAALGYRIYQAGFNRKPDLAGLGYWISQMDNGISQRDVAASFVSGAEFAALYGGANPTNLVYVTKLYNNVLQRAPEQAGLDYWVGVMDRGEATRGEVLAFFSEGAENKALVAPAIVAGIEYLPWGSKLPSNAVADYAAQYDGTVRGGDSGNISIVVNSSGTVQAGGHLNGANADVGGSTQLADGGRFEMTYAGNGQSLALKGSINVATGVATGSWINAAAKTSGVFSASKPVTQPKMFPQVQAIITQRCVGCHSAHTTFPGYNTAQAGLSFDTEAQIRAQAGLIKSAAVDSQRMPFGNATGMTQAERSTLAAWFSAGTPP
ncbi:DUF4214 domain-containing protein [Duganella sp. FT92W]|uniref:DUF4214 domain-containing protein n=1 Tax=Pseudoduganella rivuli TaxID=2666085 RepID=A0A7X2LVI8_9BURK|nr:DUF4214 domain-containing protein [Pseudoduganella rivuli]MRV74102.1 DUF4214 domain-containing protein [Pseudoduganella rivuli]